MEKGTKGKHILPDWLSESWDLAVCSLPKSTCVVGFMDDHVRFEMNGEGFLLPYEDCDDDLTGLAHTMMTGDGRLEVQAKLLQPTQQYLYTTYTFRSRLEAQWFYAVLEHAVDIRQDVRRAVNTAKKGNR